MKEKKQSSGESQTISGANLAQMIQLRAQQTLAKPSQKSTASAGFKPKPDTQPKKVSTNAKDDAPIEDDKSPSKTFPESN